MGNETAIDEIGELRKLLEGTMTRERGRLRARLEAVVKGGGKDAGELVRVGGELRTSFERAEGRRRSVPKLGFPEELPVVQKRAEIAEAILKNQVIVLCGETGSGKTTQLPKICLEAGRGAAGMIGHTQPRRIAARSVARRIAEEMSVSLGTVVGYKVRFGDQTSPDTYVKLMTDGILLAETQGDRWLEAYDTIIIDEAHERSLNIDFLLGYLKQLLPRRADLKVIVTSATIDPLRFSKHFNDCPVIEVSGRTYPVDVVYRPALQFEEKVDEGSPEEAVEQRGGPGGMRADEYVHPRQTGMSAPPKTKAEPDELPEDYDPFEHLWEGVSEVMSRGSGDLLVFLPGEREIRESAEFLRERIGGDVELVPLFARLTSEEQQKVFAAHSRRRIVLATNVAETSLTVPGIRYVIDPGVARISRYSTRSKVQRLHIEAVSRASADQRAGRCGRVGPGICLRLYSEADYLARPQFTEPEILRTNLAAVILQMQALKLGEPSAFPFMEPPDARQVRDAYNTLRELGAVDEEDRLTTLGRELAKLPTDPRIGRMIMEAEREGVLPEVLVIAAGLTVPDVRDRPIEKQAAADEKHRAFVDESSDFLTYLNIWKAFQEKSRRVSGSALRRWCRENFFSYVRMREWQEVHRQLRGLVAELVVERRRGRERRPKPKA